MIGETLSHFEIIAKLGEGGMGVVYKARDTKLNRPVAIKVLPADRIANSERKRRFVQEAQSASALNHPHIVTIYEIAEENGIDFIVMEYVAGKTLDERIPRKGMRLGEVLRVAVQVADALTAAHEAGIIHRDLKPGNIIVGDDGRVRVLDFGLAKLTEAVPESDETRTVAAASAPHTEDGTILGTVSYMSPEQAEGRKVDVRSDIFSFGSLLYEMVTGRRPFQGESNMSTLAAILKEDPKPAREIAEELPRELERIVNRCLRKDLNRRFQHMDDVKIALEELKEESDSGTLAVAPGAELVTKAAPVRWVALAAVAIIAIGVAGWLAWERSGSEQPQAGLAPVPLTSYPGLERFPSFSPDGERLAFEWSQDGESNIFVKLIGSEGQQQLTDTGLDSQPAWSPDGSEIAFLRKRPGSGYTLMLMPSVGGRERSIGEVPGVWEFEGRLFAWHPSGEWLVARESRGPGNQAGLSLLSPQTGEKRQLTSAPEFGVQEVGPAFSLDGRSLIFSRISFASADLWLLPQGDDLKPEGDPRQLTSQIGYATSPAWLSNGREIVYVSAGDRFVEHGSLWRLSLPGSAPPERQAFAGQDVFAPVVAPEGDRLAFSQVQMNHNIWQVALANPGVVSGEAERLTASTRSDTFPRYSPDGARVAFGSRRSGQSEIWISSANGSNPIQLTSFGGSTVDEPSWSPDGKWIAFKTATEDGRADLYVVGSDGGAPRRLTSDPAEEGGQSSWSADGVWIYFNSNRGGAGPENCWRIPAAGGEAIQVTTTGGAKCLEGLDGQYLYFDRNYRPPEDSPYRGYHVMRMPLAGGEPERLLGPIITHSFEAAEEGIYFAPPAAEGEGISFHFYDFASGSIRTVVTPGAPYDYGMALSPDGQHLIWSQLDEYGADLMLVEGFR